MTLTECLPDSSFLKISWVLTNSTPRVRAPDFLDAPSPRKVLGGWKGERKGGETK
jgi:hypothetical protein